MKKTIAMIILIVFPLLITSCSSQVVEPLKEQNLISSDEHTVLEEIEFYLPILVLEEVEFYLQDNGMVFTVQLIVRDNGLTVYTEPQYYLQIYDASNIEHQIIKLGSAMVSNLRVLDLFNNNRPHIVVTRGYSGDSRSQSFIWDRYFEQFLDAEVSHEISFTNPNQTILYAQVIAERDTYGIEIRTEDGDLVQSIYAEPYEFGLPIPFWIVARDMNNNGYMDIVAHRGGTQNFVHDLFIWNTDLHEFVNVIYVDFESLSFYQVHDGYLINTLRGFDSYIDQTLVWEGNRLVKIAEEIHYFPEN